MLRNFVAMFVAYTCVGIGGAEARTPACPAGTHLFARVDLFIPAGQSVPVAFAPRMGGNHKVMWVSDEDHAQPATIQTCVSSDADPEGWCWGDEQKREFRPVTYRWSDPLNLRSSAEDEVFWLRITSDEDAGYAVVMCRDESGNL